MKSTWQLQEAKARFSEVVDRAINEGPQRVTRHGKPAVVVVSAQAFEAASWDDSRTPGRSLVELLQQCPAPEIFDYIEESRREPDYGRPVEFE